MTNAKNLYVLMLALVIVLSGCFGNTTPDVDGQQNENANTNVAPLIEIGEYTTEVQFEDSTHFNVSIYRAMTDIDGQISSAGWDFDLDGTIDHSSTNVRSIDEILIPASNWFGIYGESGAQKFTTISFIAIDDEGAHSGQLITIDTDTQAIWSGDTRNSYTADDANAETSAAALDDALISMRWSHAEDDLEWAFVSIRLTVGDDTFDCSVHTSAECTIGQDGNDNNVWETDEFLILSENNASIGGDSSVTIDIYVTYRGTAVAGDSSVTVA